jgi:hypothetical protein
VYAIVLTYFANVSFSCVFWRSSIALTYIYCWVSRVLLSIVKSVQCLKFRVVCIDVCTFICTLFLLIFRCGTFLQCLNICPSSPSLWYAWHRLSCRMCVLYLIYNLNNQSRNCYFWWLGCDLYILYWMFLQCDQYIYWEIQKFNLVNATIIVCFSLYMMSSYIVDCIAFANGDF